MLHYSIGSDNPMYHPRHASNLNSKFLFSILLNAVFVVAEIFFGILSNSLALVADALHNAGDVLSLLLAWFGYWLSKKNAPQKYTYGFKNVTILAAFVNALLLFVATGALIWAAIKRVGNYEGISTGTVMWVALAGVVINGVTAYLFFHDRHRDVNIQGAYLHMFLDTLVSVGVLVAGFLIFLASWEWIDTFISFVIALVILLSSWSFFKESLNLILLAVPTAIDLEKLKEILNSQSEIVAFHDLHVWPMSTTENALSVHLVTDIQCPSTALAARIEEIIKEKFHISHVTIQIESEIDQSGCGTSC